MNITEKVMEREFYDITYKKAYLKACKWYAGNIMAINNSDHIVCKFVKKDNGCVVLEVYLEVDADELLERHCKICNEVEGLFYLNGQKHKCESCKLLAFKRRTAKQIKAVKESMKGSIL